MKQFFNITLMALAISFLFANCKKNDDEPQKPEKPQSPLTELKFNPEKLEIEKGKTAVVTIVGTLNATDKIQVENADIVTLQGEVKDNKITLLAKKVGTTKVNITTQDGKKRGTLEATVTPVFDLHFTPEKATIEEGKTAVVTIVGTLNATDKIQVESADIVTLQGEVKDNKITLLAKKVGTTKVNITTQDGKKRGTLEATVTPVFDLHFTPEKATIEEGKTTVVTIVGTLNATDKIQVENADIVALQGEVKDNKITLLAKKVGTTKVNITTQDGKKRGTLEATVTPKLLLTFSPEKATIEEGKTAVVTIVGTLNATDKIQVENADIVTLQGEVKDNKITLLAKKVGTTKVNITTQDGKKRGTLEATVTPKLLLTFSPEKATIEEGKTAVVTIVGTLNATDKIQVENADIVALQDEVKDNKITLLAKKVGTTKVNITTQDGKKRGTLEATVYAVPKSFNKIAHRANIPYYKTGINDVNTYKQLIENTLKEFDKLFTLVNKEDPYPLNKFKNKNQSETWRFGAKLTSDSKGTYLSKKENLTLKEAQKIYEDIYTYGVVYAHIELMAREAEGYRKQFPDTEIENLIQNTFDGGYATQEGNGFIEGTNRDVITNFNKIIDIVNSKK
ncbi:MAG: GAG-binding domain-containing protein [Capnocytophaga sp.]|nr:GAG-binding domain-containing protein [Capnocytophaga sp.]